MRPLLLLIGLALWPSWALASGDWLSLGVPRPLSPGAFEAGLEVRSGTSETWAQGWFAPDPNDRSFLPDSTGDTTTKVLKRVDLELQLRWQARPGLLLELVAPQVYTAFTPYPDGAYVSASDPTVRQAAGQGDLRAALRGAFTPPKASWQAAWTLGVIAPTGWGPLDAPQALVATGDGRWQALPGLLWGGGQDRALELWLQATGRWQFGCPGRVSPDLRLAYAGSVHSGGSRALAPGPVGSVWLDPRWGGDGVVGLGWNWHRDADSRQTVGLEVLGHWLSPWSMDGADVGLGQEGAVQLQPELQARYSRLTVLGGWRSGVLYGTNVLSDYWGQVIVNAAYAF